MPTRKYRKKASSQRENALGAPVLGNESLNLRFLKTYSPCWCFCLQMRFDSNFEVPASAALQEWKYWSWSPACRRPLKVCFVEWWASRQSLLKSLPTWLLPAVWLQSRISLPCFQSSYRIVCVVLPQSWLVV